MGARQVAPVTTASGVGGMSPCPPAARDERSLLQRGHRRAAEGVEPNRRAQCALRGAPGDGSRATRRSVIAMGGPWPSSRPRRRRSTQSRRRPRRSPTRSSSGSPSSSCRTARRCGSGSQPRRPTRARWRPSTARRTWSDVRPRWRRAGTLERPHRRKIVKRQCQHAASRPCAARWCMTAVFPERKYQERRPSATVPRAC